MKAVDEIIEDIRSLKVQGARNVAKAAIKAIMIYLKQSEARTVEDLVAGATKVALELMHARPTEPMARNMLEDILKFMLFEISVEASNVDEFKEKVVKAEEHYLNLFDENVKKLSEIGANYIQENALPITYCHSSTVVALLKRAYDMGKLRGVIVCETRPLYQGRKTASELADYGIDVTFIVDSAMGVFAKKADFAIVGGDAVTTAGDLVNKIGTSTLARIMNSYDKSFFSAVESWKFDPYTNYGFREPIEERSPLEVWKDAPEGVNVKNPAFDVTPARYINAFITEVGVYPPQRFEEAFEKAKHIISEA